MTTRPLGRVYGQVPAQPVYADQVEGLLDGVRQLRTTMASDLSAAAAAVDSDARGVASDIIAGDREDLAALERRADDPARRVDRPPSGRS